MHFCQRNVNDAFDLLVKGFYNGHIETADMDSRNGPVRMIPEPVIVTYSCPRERVLFNAARDANPFFHLFESLWMLAGRNDVAPLKDYVSTIGDYSDDGVTLNGAYGERWRSWEYNEWQPISEGEGLPEWRDQLQEIVNQLKADPNSRRCVLEMWDPQRDLWSESKDKCCNLNVKFLIFDAKLNMMVDNRSNDLILGMLGANVVHFSMLQEYMAACVGVEVGKYHQVTNNLHVYLDKWKPEEWLESNDRNMHSPPQVSYGVNVFPSAIPLVENPEAFDKECAQFIDSIDGDFEEPFLRKVAQPMMAAFRAHKQRRYRGDNSAARLIERVQASDWCYAGTQWLLRRQKRWEAKSKVSADEVMAGKDQDNEHDS